jgi:hypothetical protein
VVNYLGPNPNGNFLVTAGNSVTAGAFSGNGTSWSATGNIGFGTKASAYGPEANGNANVYVVAGQAGQGAFTTNLANSFTTIPQTVTGWPGTSSAAFINAGAYGQGSTGRSVFVFGGGSGRIAYTYTISATTQWQQATQTAFTTSDFINVIAFGNGTFVAVGGPGTQGKAAYSTNGTTWTTTQPQNFPLGNGVDVYALAFGDGYFVAGDNGGYIAYSSNGGQSWTLANQQPVLRGPVNAITYDTASGRFIAVGGTGAPQVAYAP